MSVDQTIQVLYKTESRRVLATLIRLLKDFDSAEEAMQEAFSIALQTWPIQGVPNNPRAWLVSTGRFKAIDQLRRKNRFEQQGTSVNENLLENTNCEFDELDFDNDQLRLIFICCHPSLSVEAQIALTLREVCGLTTEIIAKSFLTKTSTIAQRIVRAKSKIRDAGIPYEIPSPKELPDRLGSVLRVVYLVFNEGYSASYGSRVTCNRLTAEAIDLAQSLSRLLPDTEILGLWGLMLLQNSRSKSRSGRHGELIPLEQQDRNLWCQEQIHLGLQLVENALSRGNPGPYTLQGAIAAVHSEAKTFEQTDWPQIVGLYEVLLMRQPSPIVELNFAVAMAMRDGPEVGLAIMNGPSLTKALNNYYLFYAAKGGLLEQSRRVNEAETAYQRALELTQQTPEQEFLRNKIAHLQTLK